MAIHGFIFRVARIAMFVSGANPYSILGAFGILLPFTPRLVPRRLLSVQRLDQLPVPSGKIDILFRHLLRDVFSW